MHNQHRRRNRLPTALGLATVLTAGLLATGMAWGQALGSVVGVHVGPAFCGTGSMHLSQPYTCVEATVTCPGIEERPVNLRVTRPPASGPPIRGTVVVGMGGGGKGWYEANPPAAAMIDALDLAGFRVIQRAWGDDPDGETPGGWINGSIGLRNSACRYATLTRWIYGRPQLHDPETQAFCVTGNSGGSSEISYALAHYGAEEIFDLAMPTAGPPHGVVYRGCNPGNEAWVQQCNTLLEALEICPQQGPDEHTCFYAPGTIAANVDPAWELAGITPCADNDQEELRFHAVLNAAADLDYPDTRVHFVYGDDDCGSAPAMGVPYLVELTQTSTGPVSFEVVPGVGHPVPAFEAGADAIEAVITAVDGCVQRHQENDLDRAIRTALDVR